MDTTAKFLTHGILFLAVLASGVWLSQSGKPYSTLIFTLHKLFALAAVIVLGRQLYLTLRSMEVHALLITLVVLVVVCAAALFATGGLMSAGALRYEHMRVIHQTALVLVSLSLAGAVYLMSVRQL